MDHRPDASPLPVGPQGRAGPLDGSAVAGKFVVVCLVVTLLLCLGAIGLNLALDPARSHRWNVSKERAISELMRVGKVVLLDDYLEERILQKWRLERPRASDAATTVVLGSSRVLSIGLPLGMPGVLNLGVSNASLEDLLALGDMALIPRDGRHIVVGVDPWLFNEISGHDQWVALKPEVEAALAKLGSGPSNAASASVARRALDFLHEQLSLHRSSYSLKILAQHLVGSAGVVALPGSDMLPAPRGDKFLPDGSRVLGLGSLVRDPADLPRDDRKWAAYGMKKFRYSNAKFELFAQALQAMAPGRTVVLWLAPFRPSTYELLERDGGSVSDIEARLRRLAQASGVAVIGSYDPARAACTAGEFHDGAHPLPSCVARQFTVPVLALLGVAPPKALAPLY